MRLRSRSTMPPTPPVTESLTAIDAIAAAWVGLSGEPRPAHDSDHASQSPDRRPALPLIFDEMRGARCRWWPEPPPEPEQVKHPRDVRRACQMPVAPGPRAVSAPPTRRTPSP